MSWTDERAELLKKLWADGLSVAQIAAKLGGFGHLMDKGRNAVIGKVHRLKLSGRAKSPASNAQRPRKVNNEKALKNNLLNAKLKPYRESKTDHDDAILVPVAQRCTLIDLTNDTCRWPIGDPGHADFFFCGGRSVAKFPYCKYHLLVAYRPGTAA